MKTRVLRDSVSIFMQLRSDKHPLNRVIVKIHDQHYLIKRRA